MLTKIGMRILIIATAIFLVDSVSTHHYYFAAAYVLLGSTLSTKLKELK